MFTSSHKSPAQTAARLLLLILVVVTVGAGVIKYLHWRTTPLVGSYPFQTAIAGVALGNRYASLHLIEYDPAFWTALPRDAAAQGKHWSVMSPGWSTRALLLDTGKGDAKRAWFIVVPLP